jgi:alanyl-tRNA synthetase
VKTERLYREDPYAARFSARCLEAESAGEALRIVLDRTAFYPGGGGQPEDRGRLAGGEVAAFEERPDGAIVHLLRAAAHGGEKPAPAIGTAIEGEIDAARRLDLMRHHTGQHLLSGAFRQRLKAETISVHFAAEVAESCSLDLDRGPLSDAEIEAVEDEAARVTLEDRPVTAAIHKLEDAPKLGLRKPPPADQMLAAEGLRIVTIEGYDVSACCGTHVRRTGEIGSIRILGQEKVRGAARVRFVCGPRALRGERARARAAAEAIEKAGAARRAAEKRAEALEERLARAYADELARFAKAEPAGAFPRTPLTSRILDADDPAPQLVANRLAELGYPSLVASQRADGVDIVIARPEKWPAPNVAAFGRTVLAAHGAKGGGRPHFAQFRIGPGANVGVLLLDLERAWEEA